MERRRLVTWVIVVAIAVPLIVEGITLFGLVNEQFGGDGAGAGDGNGSGGVTTTPEPRVGVGDELLEETPQRETLTEATIDGGDRWTLTLTVAVNNTGENPYELTLGAVRADNRRIDGGASTGRIPPGGDTLVTTQWSLPSGTLPDAVSVTAVQYDGEGGVERTVQREVRLASIPVRG